jgi:hypothetical protein
VALFVAKTEMMEIEEQVLWNMPFEFTGQIIHSKFQMDHTPMIGTGRRIRSVKQ